MPALNSFREPIERESPVERAAHSALLAIADFYLAIQRASTVDEALRLHRVIEQVEASVDAATRAALRRADALCGQGDTDGR